MDRKQGSPHQSEGQQFAHYRSHFSAVCTDYNNSVFCKQTGEQQKMVTCRNGCRRPA